MLVLARVGSGRLVTLASGVARALVLPSVLFVGGVSMGVAYMVVMSVSFNTFNTSNYNNYLNSSSGQSTYLYWVLSELGSILGSLIGGYVASYYGFTYVVAVSVAGHLIASLLA
jgi:predicted MFS family arabinose efflux permease